jgi:hypothetical protein
MFWAFKLSFVVGILVFFVLEIVWATFEKLGNFFKPSGHPAHLQLFSTLSSPVNNLSGEILFLA